MGIIINNGNVTDEVFNNVTVVEVRETTLANVTVNTPPKETLIVSDAANIGPAGPRGPQGLPGDVETLTWSNINDKPNEFPPSPHVHSEYVRTVNGIAPVDGDVVFNPAEEFAEALETHVVAPEPHPAYDDMQSLKLIFENRLV